MCGIAGHVSPPGTFDADRLSRIAAQMADTMTHRGPDDAGVWHDPQAGAALSHRRLSIIDLSAAGHQPMVSASGRMVIAYNGEIYSHQEMRRDLEAAGVSFRGTSDTEVILEAFERWGIETTLKRMIGMFAIALWDRQSHTLTLIRDRLGIKPLYWGLLGKTMLFASELKAMVAHPCWRGVLNRDAIASFLRHNYIPAPHTAYENVHKLEPGMLLTYRPGQPVTQKRYWDLHEVAAKGLARRNGMGRENAADELDTLLRDAVKRRMVADVPLGALLSGGVDSSTVTALMQAQSSRPIKTFSIGFAEAEYNEAPHAEAIARHLGTDHTELYVRPQEALDVIPRLPDYYDEPFADSSQIPTYLVCALTRKHVTVVLSGDGGDELFCGYNRYVHGERIWRKLSRTPLALRRGFNEVVKRLPEGALDALGSLIPRSRRPQQFGLKVHKAAAGLAHDTPDALYLQLLSHWTQPDELVLGANEPRGLLWDDASTLVPSFTERMQFLDTLTYLPDDILTKVDRASMAVSLEARVPIIDHRVVEFAWSLPLSMKVDNGTSKALLRDVLYRYVPRTLIERPKMGFGVPIDIWLRGPLRDWAEALLDEQRLREQQLLKPERIRACWQAHLNGDNYAYHIWDILMLQAWLDRYEVAL